MTRRPKLLALATYPETAAATRFRLVQMLPFLEGLGWDVDFVPFVDSGFLGGFYERGGALRKGSYLARRSFDRLILALRASDADAVFVQREAALIGPPYAEAILHQLRGLPMVFDFDDAIWELHLSQSAHPHAARLLKSPNKCWYSMKHAAGVVAGSTYLGSRARECNDNVIVLPTVVPASQWTPLPGRAQGRFSGAGPIRIGWIGTHTTAHQLKQVEPALHALRAEGQEFEVHVIGAGSGFALDTVETTTRPWSLRREVEDFQRIDIGLAPMNTGPVYEGKCGFKQLQYMAVGVPFVSSLVGGARDFVIDGKNGLIAHDAEGWYRRLKALLESKDLRASLSTNGRRLVESRYSIEAQGPRFAEFTDAALRPSTR